MNRKGAIIHWTIFIIIFAIGLFAVLTFFADPTSPLKGKWQQDFLENYVYQAEKDLIAITDTGVGIAEHAMTVVGNTIFSSDLGCGTIMGVTKLNTPDTFCVLQVPERFLQQFTPLLRDETEIPYDIAVSDSIVATSAKPLVLTNEDLLSESRFFLAMRNPNVWKEQLGEVDRTTSIHPFVRYSYNPNIEIAIPPLYAALLELENAAIELIRECGGELGLQLCITDNKEDIWELGECGYGLYQEEQHIVNFCAHEYSFALDFTNGNPGTAKRVDLGDIPVTKPVRSIDAPAEIDDGKIPVSNDGSSNYVPSEDPYRIYFSAYDVGDIGQNDVESNARVAVFIDNFVIDYIPPRNPTPVSLYFVLDRTSSMNPYLEEIKKQIGTFARNLKEAQVDAKFGMVIFIDKVEGVLPLTSDVEELDRFVQDIHFLDSSADPNKDFPEGSLLAIQDAKERLFLEDQNPDSQKILVLITDAVGHNGGPFAKAETRDCSIGTTLAALVDNPVDKFFYSVSPNVNPETCGSYSIASGQFNELFELYKQQVGVDAGGPLPWPFASSVLHDDLGSQIVEVSGGSSRLCPLTSLTFSQGNNVVHSWTAPSFSGDHQIDLGIVFEKSEVKENVQYQLDAVRCCDATPLVTGCVNMKEQKVQFAFQPYEYYDESRPEIPDDIQK